MQENQKHPNVGRDTKNWGQKNEGARVIPLALFYERTQFFIKNKLLVSMYTTNVIH